VPSEHGLPLSALIAKIGDSYFLVGKGYGGPAPATGELFVGMNDSAGTYGDNLGEMNVRVLAVPARMPELRGRTRDEATVILRRLDRAADQVGADSNTTEAGRIFAQNVEPGTLMQQVGPITLTFSTGPKANVPPPPTPVPVLMPDVTHLPYAEAEGIVRALYAGPIAKVEQESTENFGFVFDQAPKPDTDLRSVKEVVLYTSSGPGDVLVPSLIGLTKQQAEEALRNVELTSVTVEDAQSGLVYKQSPPADERIPRNGEVSIYLAAAAAAAAPAPVTAPTAEMVEIPQIVGLRKADAEAALDKVGLRAFTVEDTHRGPTGFVYDQTPGAGERLPRNDQVSVYVSMPREIPGWPWLPIGCAAVLVAVGAAFAPKAHREWWIRRLNIEPSLERKLADVEGLSAPAAVFSIGMHLESGEAKTVGELQIERTEVLS
jgi:beta-lactam-binding protein with PASTA domain